MMRQRDKIVREFAAGILNRAQYRMLPPEAEYGDVRS